LKEWRKDASRKDYLVAIETNEYGFRIFGNMISSNCYFSSEQDKKN